MKIFTSLCLATMLATTLCQRAWGDAFVGEPFGVGELRVTLAGEGLSDDQPDRAAVWVTEDDGRLHYPVIDVRGRSRVVVKYLFTGEEPLRVRVHVDGERMAVETIRPQSDFRKRKRAMRRWWGDFTRRARRQARSSEFHPQVANYLVAMLGQRLGQNAPGIRNRFSGNDRVDKMLGLLMGAESIRLAMQRDTFLNGTSRVQTPSVELPDGAAPPSIDLPEFDEDAKIEAIAMHVPAECFYLRCGSFENFQWLNAIVNHWGGGGRNLVSLRSLRFDIAKKLERQLALEQTTVSQLLGKTVVSDVALIGTDPFFRAGPSFGILFEASNGLLLTTEVNRLRQQFQQATPGAEASTVQIGGQQVAFLTSPGNEIRSFYAVDGNYHLITTSRTLVRRFLEAGRGVDPLGELDEFHFARTLMPVDDNHTAFVYLSDPFFRNIIGPQYRVEMTRRMQAVADIELAHLAQLAGNSEDGEVLTLDGLQRRGFLPRNFTTRPDGSQTIPDGATFADSLRGRRGSFLPVADVEFDRITASEAAAYAEFVRYYNREWRRMDPVIIGLHRRPATRPDRERLVLDIHITPYARQQYGFLTWLLGEPSTDYVAPLSTDLAHVYARTKFWGPIFAGLRESHVDFSFRGGKLLSDAWNAYHYYFGNARKEGPGLVHRDADAFDEEGYAPPRSQFEPWSRKLGEFLVGSSQRDLLASIGDAELRVRGEGRPAQIRLMVGDLCETKLGRVAHAFGYLRSRKASAGNVRFLQSLVQQLRVPPDTALETAELILDAEMACPLGGQYERDADPFRWRSTAWTTTSFYESFQVLDSYRFPFLQVLRGIQLDFRIDESTITVHCELEIAP